MIDFTENDSSITFTVRVIPRASKTEIVGEHDGALKIKLKSPPVDGGANKELIGFLAKVLKIGRSNIEIISGETSREKKLRVYGLTEEILWDTLLR